MSEDATYLYALARPIPAAALAGLRGIGGAEVRVLAEGEIACVVSTVELAEFGEQALRENLERLDWLERVAREHDEVVRAVYALGPTLPVRLATVYHDDASTLRHADELRAEAVPALAKIEGREEWGVKVFHVRPAVTTAATERARSGADYMRRRRAELQQDADDAARAAADATSVLDRLAGLSVEIRRHRPQDPRLSGSSHPMLLNAACLVDRARVPEFRAVVDELAAERPAGSVVLTGPWPPYSFTGIQDNGADAR